MLRVMCAAGFSFSMSCVRVPGSEFDVLLELVSVLALQQLSRCKSYIIQHRLVITSARLGM